MGTYIYGVTSKSRPVKNVGTVYQMDFITKDTWGTATNGRIQATIARFRDKEPMQGKLVAFDLIGKNSDEFISIYRYNLGVNTFFDSNMANFLEFVSYAQKRGNRYYVCSEEDYKSHTWFAPH